MGDRIVVAVRIDHHLAIGEPPAELDDPRLPFAPPAERWALMWLLSIWPVSAIQPSSVSAIRMRAQMLRRLHRFQRL